MQNRIQDRQVESFNKLIDEDIEKLVNESGFSVNGFDVKFKLLPINTENVHTVKGTKYVSVNVSCEVSNGKDVISENIHVLKLPVLTELGFVFGENANQILDLYSKTLGWSFGKKKSDSDMAINASLVATRGPLLTYSSLKSKNRVLFSRKAAGEQKYVDIGVFLRAITGYTSSRLAEMFGYQNSIVTQIFASDSDCKNRNDCIDAVAKTMLGIDKSKNLGSTPARLRAIMNNLMKSSYLNVSKDGTRRLDYLQSYLYRAQNKILNENITVGDKTFKRGQILRSEDLQVLNNADIPSLSVMHNDKVYVLHKFAHYTFPVYGMKLLESAAGIKSGTILTLDLVEKLNESNLTSVTVSPATKDVRPITYTRDLYRDYFTVDDYLAAFDIWVNNANGFDSFDNEYELTNRVAVPFSTSVLTSIDANLKAITRCYTESFEVNNTDMPLIEVLPDISGMVDSMRIINYLTDKNRKTTQTSDNTNILSRVAKNGKITATIDGNSVTPELVNVQNLQEGRLDTLDVPESSKIGVVHNKTILSSIDEFGYITQPFIKVCNGKVLSEEPVYLNASQELNQYVAEWDETFMEEDGTPKSVVTARYNGDILSVPMSYVTLQEYSPYQSMSISHSTIPYPGHSNGKRITMSCNQQKQAIPTIKLDRPFVNGGGESLLDIGTVKASEVLEAFINKNYAFREYSDRIMKSSVTLVSMQKCSGNQKGKREYTFFINDAPDIIPGLDEEKYKVSITAIYLAKGSEEDISTYQLVHKPNHVYKCNDVILHDIGYVVEDCDLELHLDTGHHKIDPEIFKSGIALCNNLNVVIKTCEGSTIDDACVISYRLISDDQLTSVYIFSVTEECKRYDGIEEAFGSDVLTAPSYLNKNGLPAVGTMLQAGDPVICKTSKVVKEMDKQAGSNANQMQTKAKYKFIYLKDCKSGQVISTNIYTKDNRRFAEVVIATRALIEVGDKLSGRHGNKSVVAKIKPMAEMPYNPETGFTADIIINPLGIPSRQNISQLIDIPESYVMREEGKRAIVSPYNKDDIAYAERILGEHNVHQEMFIDGRTGQFFSRPCAYGVISMYKLHHMVRRKLHSIGFNAPVGVGDLQPKKGIKNNGGQDIGEMETWCLQGIGANALMQELFGARSDDVTGKNALVDTLDSDMELEDSGAGENYNDLAIQACFRTLGAEISIDETTKEVVVEPVTDNLVKRLSKQPVLDKNMLHSTSIFGKSDSAKDKAYSRDKWGWINLNTKIINPLFVYKGSLGKYLLCTVRKDSKDITINLGKKKFELFFNNTLFVDSASVFPYTLYAKNTESSTGEDANIAGRSISEVSESRKPYLLTGMPAVVWLLEHTDLKKVLDYYKKVDDFKKSTDKLTDEAKYANDIKNLLDKGINLSDFVLSTFPVLPQVFRVSFKGSNMNRTASFDWYYNQILAAADAVKAADTLSNQLAVYTRIVSFLGIDPNLSNSKSCKKYKPLLNFFVGKGSKDHGYYRKKALSKRIFASGRTVIVPAGDTTMKPTSIGIPYLSLIKMYEIQLIHLLRKNTDATPEMVSTIKDKTYAKMMLGIASNNFSIFMKGFKEIEVKVVMDPEDVFKKFDKLMRSYIEGDDTKEPEVVISGRQPSLHRYSIRGFYPKVVTDKAVHIHPLVCSGYNADFDGDQMWFAAVLTPEAKREAMNFMSAWCDVINPKDNSLILSHAQDISLGIYFMTMLEDNAASMELSSADVISYSSIERIRADVDLGIIKPSTLVSLNRDDRVYCALAGRMLFNDLFTDGFSDMPFTNVLGIKGLKENRYCDLKYDAVITCGKGGSAKSIKLSKITNELYETRSDDWLDYFQALSEFGFKYSDLSGVSLGFDDLNLKYGKEDILREGNSIKAQLELDYLNGLLTAEDKTDAIHSIYDQKASNGVHQTLMQRMKDSIDPNNNISIIMNSGARGNDSQLMAMCGFVGNLQKTKTEDMESPVLSNYTEGLSSFAVHMASYSARTGLASTQNETRNAGYSTHKVVFMASGVEIVEEDCGIDPHANEWDYKISWGAHINEYDKFKPTPMWATENLVGKEISVDDTEALNIFGLDKDNRVITKDAVAHMNLVSDGFHSLKLADGTLYVVNVAYEDADSAVIDKLTAECSAKYSAEYPVSNTKVISPLFSTFVESADSDNSRLFMDFINVSGSSMMLTRDCIYTLLKHHVKELATEMGVFSLRYKMDNTCRSMLMHRVGLPGELQGLDLVHDRTYNTDINVVTEETLNQIERDGLDYVPIRTMLKCRSEHGVCAHCYGLMFTSRQLPRIHTPVGYESAQAIGEPAAQLTMSLINKGGAAGASVASGIDIFEGLLEGKVPSDKKTNAMAAKHNGYIRYSGSSDIISVYVEPANMSCELCTQCKQRAESSVCPRMSNVKGTPYMCALTRRIEKDRLLYADGEFVYGGEQIVLDGITDGRDDKSGALDNLNMYSLMSPDEITTYHDSDDAIQIWFMKQMQVAMNYFRTFQANGIDINARHFELLARIQNLYATVRNSEDPNFDRAELVEVPTLLKSNKKIDFDMQIVNRATATIQNSGILTAAVFEDVASIVANAATKGFSQSIEYNCSPIAKVAAGFNIREGSIKSFSKPKIKQLPKNQKAANDQDIYSTQQIEPVTNEEPVSFDFDDLFGTTDFNFDMDNTPKDADVSVPEIESVDDVIDKDLIPDAREIDSFDNFEDSKDEEPEDSKDLEPDFDEPEDDDFADGVDYNESDVDDKTAEDTLPDDFNDGFDNGIEDDLDDDFADSFDDSYDDTEESDDRSADVNIGIVTSF